jgi:hypothetical protein
LTKIVVGKLHYNAKIGRSATSLSASSVDPYKPTKCPVASVSTLERLTQKDIGAKIRRSFTPAKVDKLLFLMSAMKQKALVKEYVDRIGRVSNANMDG